MVYPKLITERLRAIIIFGGIKLEDTIISVLGETWGLAFDVGLWGGGSLNCLLPIPHIWLHLRMQHLLQYQLEEPKYNSSKIDI